MRTHESRELRGAAATVALLVEQRPDLGRPVDRAFLAGIVDTADRVSTTRATGRAIVAQGKAYDGGG